MRGVLLGLALPLFLGASVGTGCYFWEDCTPQEAVTVYHPIESGQYLTPVDEVVYDESRLRTSVLSGALPRALTIDRNAGTVEIRYRRERTEVTELWSLGEISEVVVGD